MSNIELGDFNDVVNSLIKRTHEGSIVWEKLNPTTFIYKSDSGRIVLQEVSRNVRTVSGGLARTRDIKSYLFQVIDNGGVQQLVVNTAELADTLPILSSLFENISSGLTKKGIDFLRGIVEK